jgi:hypothetical protein
LASSTDLPYILSALFSGAIELAEMRAWADDVLLSETNPPLWVVDLSMYEGFPKDLYKIRGIMSSDELQPEEETALLYFSMLRGRLHLDDAVHALEEIWSGKKAPPSLRKHLSTLIQLREAGRSAEAETLLREVLTEFRSQGDHFLSIFPPTDPQGEP